MLIGKAVLKYRPHDKKLNVVLEDLKKGINRVVDYLNEQSAMGGTLAFDTSDLAIDAEGRLYILDSGIDHDATTNFVANEHLNHSNIHIIAGTGLSGGGAITSDVTLNAVESDPVFSSWLEGPPNISLFTNDVGYIALTPTRGDLIYANSTPAWAKFAKGTSGYLIGYNATDLVQINPATLNVDKVDGKHAADFLPTTAVLNDLYNVYVPSPSNGDVLTWNSATSKWIASTPSGGGGGTECSRGQKFTSNGTFTVPSGVTLVWVTMIGGGGSGGEGATAGTGKGGGGGGGSGEMISRRPVTVTPSANITVTVGAGGTGGNSGSGGEAGSNGGASSFAAASGTITAAGGKGGSGGTGVGGAGGAGGGVNAGSGGTGGNGASGSAGSAPTSRIEWVCAGAGGGGGGDAGASYKGGNGASMALFYGGTGGNGSANQGAGGGGAGSCFGAGGNGGNGAVGTGGTGGSASANTGAAGGGGGQGNTTSGYGGNGGSGFVLVEWISPAS